MASEPDTRRPKGWAPYRVAILAELQPREAAALRCPVRLRPEVVSLRSFDRLLARVEPAFRLWLTDPTSMKDVEVDVRWKSWGDVLGAGLLASPAVVAMSDARSSLLRGSPERDPFQFVDRVLPGNEAWLPRSNAPAVKASTTPPQTQTGSGSNGSDEPEPPPARSAQAPAGDPLGALFDLVDLPSQSSQTSTGNAAPTRQYASAGAAVESAMSALVCQGLAHPEYQRLRRVWQSLHLLLEAFANSEAVECCLIDTSTDLDQLSQSLDLAEADLLVIEAPFEACPRDSEKLNFLANWATDHSLPVIATLDPSWFARPGTSAPTPKIQLTEPARALLDAIGRREAARWLVLCANDLCASEPASVSTLPGGLPCSQPRELETSWSFVPASVAVTTLVVGSLIHQGEPFFSERWGSAQLRSDALYETTAKLGPVAIGTRWFCSDDNADELAALGIGVLVPEKNRDRVRVKACPSAFRPRDNGGFLAKPASTLHDQMLAGKIVQLLMTCRASGFGATDLDQVPERLRDEIQALFPKATPSGPIVEVNARNGALEIGIEPRNYGQLTLEQLRLSVPLR